ncbi:hypothetical protein EMCG_01883 [[Emmonsia] crescens]|uniref:RRM domain-containing protein n=1 Tax=[Emmonsia] crescens TaxID=73230 RepID=A0A0G2J245_9EURO|nr:hypothetical protein EMCG_01883 [Emmonsia crescens UAMH 3008]
MAAGKEAVSFDEIIQAARMRRKKQALTDRFFETKRRSSAPGPGSGAGSGAGGGALVNRVSAAPGSLASRVGVAKRSTAAITTRKPGAAVPTHPARQNRMFSDIITKNNGQATVQDRGPGFSIKGSASGPCVVLGSNFAPGTTAADIESALEPVGGAMLGCKIVSTDPVVTAEMIFEERSGAESVVARFNNQKADGRILHIRIKPGPPPPAPRIPAEINQQQQQTRLRHHRPQPIFDNLREQADRERREQRRADPQIQDGRYGFDDTSRQQHDKGGANSARGGEGQRGGGGSGRNLNAGNGNTGLYSDQMVIDEPGRNSRSRGRRGR